MLAFDLIGLAILWSIGLLALIQTINSRSAIRASLSGIITVVIFLIACVFSYLKIEGYGSFVSPELSPTSILATNLAIGNAESGTSDGKKLSSEDRPSGASSATNAIHSLERYVASAVKIADEAKDSSLLHDAVTKATRQRHRRSNAGKGGIQSARHPEQNGSAQRQGDFPFSPQERQPATPESGSGNGRPTPSGLCAARLYDNGKFRGQARAI